MGFKDVSTKTEWSEGDSINKRILKTKIELDKHFLQAAPTIRKSLLV